MNANSQNQERGPLRDHEIVQLANNAWVRTLAGSGRRGPGPDFPNGRWKAGPVQAVRALADQEAFWSHFHDPAIHGTLLPKEPGAQGLMTSLERSRVRVLGSRAFPGAGWNMGAHFSLSRQSLSLTEKVAALAFVRLAQECRDHFSAYEIAQLQKPFHALSGLWETLAGLVDDQEAFGREVLAFLDASTEARILAQRLVTETNRAEAEAIPGLPDALFQQEDEPEPDLEEKPVFPGTEKESRSDSIDPNAAGGYRAYTTAFDRVSLAEALFSPGETRLYSRQLDHESLPYRRTVTRLARRLMQQIMAWQRRFWVFDQDEGVLDPRRLAGLAVDPTNHRIFMQETDAPFPATVVSLLIDNSGSMKGRPIQTAALTVQILAAALERCGVKTEVLGYTTRAWNGGRAREQWHKAGSPPRPGRLNELLHIVYKGADIPWRRARHKLAIMLHPDLLKENIDGEALLWAWRRLLTRPEQRRILLVVCDGSPHDEATLQTNPPDTLTRHLGNVIGRIERSPIQLAAIGVGHPVGRFYRRAVFLEKMENLAESLTHQILQLLAPASSP